MANIKINSVAGPGHAQVIFAPDQVERRHDISVFLAGSLFKVNGKDWRHTVATALSSQPITIFDPYRPNWDSSWPQSISFAPLREQIEWELEKQEAADVIAVYLGPEGQAPISLLELGLGVRSGKVIVACSEDYCKRVNVQVVCARFGIEVLVSLNELIDRVEQRVRRLTVSERP